MAGEIHQRHEQHMLRMEGMHEVLKQEQIALTKELRELAASHRETAGNYRLSSVLCEAATAT